MNREEFISTLKAQGRYQTPRRRSYSASKSMLGVSWKFYVKALSIIYCSYSKASKDESYSPAKLQSDAYRFVQLVEEIGGNVTFTGLDRLQHDGIPIVFIGNHMSALETFLLPCDYSSFQRYHFYFKKKPNEVSCFWQNTKRTRPHSSK